MPGSNPVRSAGGAPQESYQARAVPELQKALGRRNPHALPRVVAVVVTSGVGKRRGEKQFLADVERGLALLTGQKPAPTQARKSIAGFKVRQGQVVGYRCTLRGQRREDFLCRLNRIALPRVRDFRGISPSAIDAQGNLTLGFPEAAVFPEVDPAAVESAFGLQVTIVTSARNRREAQLLFRALGFPLLDESWPRSRR